MLVSSFDIDSLGLDFRKSPDAVTISPETRFSAMAARRRRESPKPDMSYLVFRMNSRQRLSRDEARESAASANCLVLACTGFSWGSMTEPVQCWRVFSTSADVLPS